jgi:pimeloyl-ACP methyl ester carboxylesterase
MGGLPAEHPDRYRLASPLELLPLGTPQLLVWGTNDRPDLVDENRRYCVAATASGDTIDPLELPGADHFTVIDPSTLTWIAIRDRLDRLFPVHGSTHQEGARARVQATHLAAPLHG